jgi:hypothetical protein
MPRPSDDPIVKKKNEVQKALLKKAGGDLKKFNEVVHELAEKARVKYPGGFKSSKQ